jgi:mannose/cellobiose epimerase-like protein (N-acyl-D-glucosamine 2-epimerase family)
MALTRLVKWFVGEALPRWATTGFDDRNGHFHEGLTLDGTPEIGGLLRTRAAARQIYVFAHAHTLGVAPDDGLEKAERAFANLHACGWISGDRPGYARSIDRLTGLVVDPVRDLYDQACVLLALAWLLKATGKESYRRHLEETLRAIDATLASSGGGWAEDSEYTMPRRQNPHMHFFEACLALVESTGEHRHIDRARELYALFGTRFFDQQIGTLREFFGSKWEIDDAFESGRLEPGHMAEWVWLLRRYSSLTSTNVDQICGKLLNSAQVLGAVHGSSFLIDQVSDKGGVLKNSRRLWPQAELIKALIVQFEALGEKCHLDQANDIATKLFRTYLVQTPSGTWRDCFDLEGRAIATSIPSSSHYHLWTAVAELLVRPELIV